MPLEKTLDIDSSKILIWKITENESDLIQLCEDYLITNIDSYKNEKARIQWLASRVLLTIALKTNNIKCDGVSKDEFGKPFLINSEWHFSISHSGNFAALILSKNDFIGIDIETKFEQCFKLKSKFACNSELEFINHDAKKAALIWSAKESIYKAYGKKKLIFKDDMKLVDEPNFRFEFSKIENLVDVSQIFHTEFLLTFIT